MTKLEHASLELLKAMESDANNAQELYNKAKDDLAAIGILWAQGYIIAQVEKEARKQVLFIKLRSKAMKIFPDAEFFPGDPCPTVPVYEGGRKGIVLGAVDSDYDPDNEKGFQGWWRVRIEGVGDTLQWPPTLTTTPPSKK